MIACIFVVGIVVLIVFIRHKRRKEELDYYMYEHYGRWEKCSIEQLEDEISRIIRKKKELQNRLDAFSRATSKVIIGDEDSDSARSQMLDIKWQLEKIDREEEDIRKILRDKKTVQERARGKKPSFSRESRHTDKRKDLYREINLSKLEASTGIKKKIIYDRDNVKQKLEVTIPPGVKEGSRIRYKGMGSKGNPPGDLYLIVRINID